MLLLCAVQGYQLPASQVPIVCDMPFLCIFPPNQLKSLLTSLSYCHWNLAKFQHSRTVSDKSSTCLWDLERFQVELLKFRASGVRICPTASKSFLPNPVKSKIANFVPITSQNFSCHWLCSEIIKSKSFSCDLDCALKLQS